jgi:hypothetical protein
VLGIFQPLRGRRVGEEEARVRRRVEKARWSMVRLEIDIG